MSGGGGSLGGLLHPSWVGFKVAGLSPHSGHPCCQGWWLGLCQTPRLPPYPFANPNGCPHPCQDLPLLLFSLQPYGVCEHLQLICSVGWPGLKVFPCRNRHGTGASAWSWVGADPASVPGCCAGGFHAVHHTGTSTPQGSQGLLPRQLGCFQSGSLHEVL